ncbi:chitoporin ChiP [Proteus hauseri]|uniref:chitoporin ChiP n=1 Tax=Proteus hauseri TaxID=183417 RepID=UPI0032DB1B46
MVMQHAKPGRVALAVMGALLVTALPAHVSYAEGFIDDSTLTGGLYYWQRDRDRKQIEPGSPDHGKYKANLHHSSANANLDFSSGYLADFIGIDLAAFGALELNTSGPAAPNEIGFSDAKSRWDEKWTGDRSGMSVYKAAAKFKLGNFWAQGGYIQPKGQTLLRPHWSFLPGTYRGAEAGAVFDFDKSGELSFSYMWTDEYKAPWYRNMYNFRKADLETNISYLHSFGAKYDFKNSLVLEAAFGQADGYIDQYFGKVSYDFPISDNALRTSYQFYGAKDKVTGGGVNDVYDGLAWLQALTFGYTHNVFDFKVEGTWVKAEGNQGYFLQRMTPGWATSNGRLDIWWDGRSDFNADGEKALYAGVMYDLKNWDLSGWAVGTSYVYAWDAKPSGKAIYDQNKRIRESAWNADIMYTVQEGRAKGTLFKLHYTRYDNHSDIPSYDGGFGNIFQDEKDVKFNVIMPFTIF